MFWDLSTQGGTAFNEHTFYKNLSNSMCEGGVKEQTWTGEWASLQWYANGSLWNSNDYYIYFRALYRHSPDFVKLVCKTVADLNDEMTLLYKNQLNEDGKVEKQNIIDSIVLDDKISGSIKRNNDALKSGYANYSEDVKSLRNWLQKRNEWMQKHYAEKLTKLLSE